MKFVWYSFDYVYDILGGVTPFSLLKPEVLIVKADHMDCNCLKIGVFLNSIAMSI